MKGYSLLETAVAAALWMLIMAGLLQVWRYTSAVSHSMIAAQNVFENARSSLDALLINLQLADTVKLENDGNGLMKKLTLTELDPSGKPADYIFYFDAKAVKGTAKYHRLEFGLNNEFASHIKTLRLELSADRKRMYVTVSTDGETAPSLTFSGSADVRYKDIMISP